MLKDIIHLKFKYDIFKTEEIKNGVIELYNSIIEKALELGIWDESIKAIIITDDFENKVEEQADKWSIKANLSKEYL